MESPQNRQFIYTTNWGVLPEIFWRTGAIFWGVVILPHFPARPVGMVGGSVETPKAHPNRHLEPFLPPQGEIALTGQQAVRYNSSITQTTRHCWGLPKHRPQGLAGRRDPP